MITKTTLFFSWLLVQEVWWLVPSKASKSKKLLEVYSPSKSHLKHLITVECYVLTRAWKLL